jgi:ABC-2 type transport system permease protein
MIDDPNTSSRSALLFIPMLPLSAAFFLSANPDGLPMQILSLLPGASSTAMPVRLILGEVSWWELASSFVFLILGIFALRIVAARIFAAGIMMYGTEPSWIDVFAWVFSRKSITLGQVATSLPDIQSRSTSQQKANP